MKRYEYKRQKGGFIPVRYKSPRIKNSNGAAATPVGGDVRMGISSDL